MLIPENSSDLGHYLGRPRPLTFHGVVIHTPPGAGVWHHPESGKWADFQFPVSRFQRAVSLHERERFKLREREGKKVGEQGVPNPARFQFPDSQDGALAGMKLEGRRQAHQ